MPAATLEPNSDRPLGECNVFSITCVFVYIYLIGLFCLFTLPYLGDLFKQTIHDVS